ncbi:hypothetical protein CR513_27152, partial [Mucuna pruriens]
MDSLALNKLGAMVSTLHLGMKRSMGRPPGVNVLDFDVNPRCEDECERPLLIENLKEVNIRPKPAHKTKIGTTLAQEDESRLVAFLRENRDVFAWSSVDMPGIDPDLLCHHLSISLGYLLVAQRRRMLGEEK